jgi:hypothetical protein
MMTEILPGQMTWKPQGVADSTVLHLRQNAGESWQPYTAFPQYVLPDPPEFSTGYATFLALLKKQWQLV